MANLLLEIGTEEIPASYIEPALSGLKDKLTAALEENRLAGGDVSVAGTPRRLTIFIEEVPAAQKGTTIEALGPPERIAFDDEGHPTKAALGFARNQGIDVSQIQIRETKKGKYCFAVKEEAGQATMAVLPGILSSIIAGLSFPKSMHWRAKDFYFARPIQSLLALLDADVVEFEVNGVRTGRETAGHPFLAPGMLTLERADLEAYKNLLQEHFVVADIEERRSTIRDQIEALLAPHGAQLEELALLDEVTNLVELPNSVEGRFNESYLALPADVLEAAMMEHQRYFPVRDADGKLLARFVTVINRTEEYADGIREGNERVLSARLSDAQFFWQEDRKTSLAELAPGLKDVLYQEKLGSYLDRTNRLVAIASHVAEQLGLSPESREMTVRAAQFCKADLLTHMVGEFPKLQGIMGREYALADGEPKEVAHAIAEHYAPRSAEGALPETETGIALGLTEKLDSLAACFAAGLEPTGSQDPYALRRSAQGLIRIILERKLTLSLRSAVETAEQALPAQLRQPDLVSRVMDFLANRLYHTFLDRGYQYDIINAALASGFDDVLDLRQRVDSLTDLASLPEWSDLVTVVERTFNITKGTDISGDVDEALLEAEEEKKLWEVYCESADKVTAAIDRKQYHEASLNYARVFAAPVHDFFDKVFVNVEQQTIRENRLRLVKKINELYSSRIADLSKIVVAEQTEQSPA